MAHDRAFSTLHLPPHRRVARWTEEASDRFVASGFQVREPERFVASMLHRDLETLSVTRILSAGHGRKRVTRSRRQAAQAHEDFFLVSVQVEGRCWLEQGARSTLLEPGQFAIYDTRRPYELQLDGDYQQVVLRIPRATLTALLPDGAARTAVAVGAGSPAARQLLRGVREACQVGSPGGPGDPAGADARALAHDLLAAVARGLHDAPSATATAGRRALLARLKAHVDAQLGDPQLSVAGLAAAFGLSTSYLHQLFRAEGSTVERWIWARRLAACERVLVDPAAAQLTLTRIAFSHGFSDAAHFSRSFQQRYGAAPRDYRRSALAALAGAAAATAPAEPAPRGD